MKASVICLVLLISSLSFAGSLSGVVEVKGEVPKGTLYIFAKKFGGKMPMPLAVKKITNPTFPLKFTLDESNKMMKQMPFKGPFVIVARISPSGSAMDKTGVEISTSKPIKIGTKDIKLILSSKKK